MQLFFSVIGDGDGHKEHVGLACSTVINRYVACDVTADIHNNNNHNNSFNRTKLIRVTS